MKADRGCELGPCEKLRQGYGSGPSPKTRYCQSEVIQADEIRSPTIFS